MTIRLRVAAVVTAALAGSSAAWSEVQAQAVEGFVIAHELVLETTPERAYTALTDEVSHWWDARHSYSGEAANFSLDARAGGCFCEKLANGGSVEHLRVVFASPGKLLRMAGGLGPLQGMGATGVMDFAFEPAEENGRTRLKFHYTVGGYVPDGLAALAAPVDGVLGGQLTRLAAHVRGDTIQEP